MTKLWYHWAGMRDAQNFWDREIQAPQHQSWLEEPVLHEYANSLIGDGKAVWPIDWFAGWLQGRRFRRALSIGCGTGALERDLVVHELVDTIDAFDASVASLLIAQRLSVSSGMVQRIRYFAADFNEPTLPRRAYDLVVFHQSAHHVAKLEKLFRAILRALHPKGLVYMDEYVGPSRFEWTDDMLAEHRRVYADLPVGVRTGTTVPFPIQEDDPSEAFRSSSIEPQLSVGFRTLQRRPYGGTLLSVLCPLLKRDGWSPDVVHLLIDQERALLRSGSQSYYALIVAQPRRGLIKFYADWHYYLVPKLKRVWRIVQARWRETWPRANR